MFGSNGEFVVNSPAHKKPKNPRQHAAQSMIWSLEVRSSERWITCKNSDRKALRGSGSLYTLDSPEKPLKLQTVDKEIWQALVNVKGPHSAKVHLDG